MRLNITFFVDIDKLIKSIYVYVAIACNALNHIPIVLQRLDDKPFQIFFAHKTIKINISYSKRFLVT